MEALLDAAAADNAVARGLLARGNPVIEEVRQKERADGRAEGELAVLLRLLERKFGPLSAEVVERLKRADVDQLLGWSDRILTATTLDEVFVD